MMNETLIIILNVISIGCIIFFASYLSSLIINPFNAVYRLAIKRDPTHWNRIKKLGTYLWAYALIPILLFIVLILISQLKIGNLKIRLDATFFVNCVFWIVLPAFVIGLIHRDRKRKNKQL